MAIPYSVYPWIVFGLFLPLALANGTGINMGIQISVSVPAFSSFVCISRSGIAGS